jgi:hypothetical protein
VNIRISAPLRAARLRLNLALNSHTRAGSSIAAINLPADVQESVARHITFTSVVLGLFTVH